jgi:DNA mismatch repair protein MutL
MTARINKLSVLLANQIAAGEVVARPVSVVKELIENSLDAGATVIDIAIGGGGTELISISDNGVGIHRDDLVMAVSRHATSKISQVSDLANINTLGFRGEALASICAVARVTLASAQEAGGGWQLEVAGVTEEPRLLPVAQPLGTTITVRDLFFNTPARRKFLRNEKTEFNHIDLLVKRLALSTFPVHLKLSHNGKMLRQYYPVSQEEDCHLRLRALFPAEFIAQSLKIKAEHNNMKLWGWIGLPNIARNQNDAQYFYVNNRIVRDKLLNHALRSAYRDVLYQERYPLYALFLELLPQEVDVNVHPTKDEVRFCNTRLIYDFIHYAVQDALVNCSIAKVSSVAKAEATIAHVPLSRQQFTKPQQMAVSKTIPSKATIKDNYAAYHALHSPLPVNNASATVQEIVPMQTELGWSVPAMQQQDLAQPPIGQLGQAIGQFLDIYILAASSQGLIIIDMHAAHERVLYERLKQQIATQQVLSQVLLLPLVINLPANALLCYDELRELFNNWGFQLEQLSASSMIVRAIPQLFNHVDIQQLLVAVANDLVSYTTTKLNETTINKLLATLACRAAIHAKHTLSLSEMNALLRDMEATPHNQQCNHGRPVWVCLSPKELDKLFYRGR